MATTSTPEHLRDLKGRVITPDDADYDQMRTVYGGGLDNRPSLIVRVADDTDVVRVIGHARETGLELAIRSGGHSFAGHSTTDGGILLDLRDMKALDIDTEQRTIWAESGLTSGDVTRRAEADGLVVGFGDTASVGIGGITLGGGIGYLVRKYGLTIDNLLAADLVTANGEVLRVDADAHPDLFWAIRGGGGNFGVVTRFQYQLHELPSCYRGWLVLPATAEVVNGFVEAASAAAEDLSAIANIMPAPPMPFLAEEDFGRLVLMAGIVYAGPAEEGVLALEPFRALASPLADLVEAGPYTGMFPPEEGEPFHPTSTSKNLFLDAVDMNSAEIIVRGLEESDATVRAVQLRVLGGAMSRVPEDATAFAHRACRIMANVAAFYEEPEDKARREAWVADLVASLPHRTSGAYVNFLTSTGEAETRDAYPPRTAQRLAEVKRRYDPSNLFHRNHNILPE
jgi:FAD/FMN-containing dehydrogenase